MRDFDFKDNAIINMSFSFALKIIEFSDRLKENQKYSLSDQILRSGTSIGASIREAQNAESMADFIHKFKIAAKEADESEYWLLLCKHSKSLPETEELLNELSSIKKVIGKIITTSKDKMKR